MGSRQTVDIDFTELMGAVGQLNRDLSNATRTLPIIAETLHSSVMEVFEKEGAVGGAPRWPDLSPATKAARRGGAVAAVGRMKGQRLANGRYATREQQAASRQKALADIASGKFKILQDTGVLVGSITPASSDRYVEAYTGVRYAKFHVSKAPRRVIPLRDFFAIDEREFYAEAAEILLAAIT